MVALVLRANRLALRDGLVAEGWKGALSDLIEAGRRSDLPRRPEPVGLQFRLRRDDSRTDPVYHPETRPVRRGLRGGWIMHKDLMITFYQGQTCLALSSAQEHWFRDLMRTVSQPSLAGWTELPTVRTDHFWTLLRSAPDLGIQLVADDSKGRIELSDQIELVLNAVRQGEAVKLRTVPRVGGPDGEVLPGSRFGRIGDTGYLVLREAPQPKTLFLGPKPITSAALERRLLSLAPLRIPIAEFDTTLERQLTLLGRLVPVVSSDGSVDLPAPSLPELVLAVEPCPAGRSQPVAASLSWRWRYGAESAAHFFLPDADPPEPLSPPDRRPQVGQTQGEAEAWGELRDSVGERQIMDQVWAIRSRCATFADPSLQATELLEGLAVARFATSGLPELRLVPGVVVEGELPPTPELRDPPVVRLMVAPSGVGDWFDLTGMVLVGGQELAFQDLFAALAAGQSQLMAPNGAVVDLDQPPFRRLAGLIAEARGLSDARQGPRLARYQASLLGDLEELAAEFKGAEEWRAAMARLRRLAASGQMPGEEPLPVGLKAELRPYQQAGYDWLVFLWRHQLGGVLADDMGLGKTVQALAMMARATELMGRPAGGSGDKTTDEPSLVRLANGTASSTGRAPFLVVAPSSVVPGWLEEAARFTPNLRVASASSTRARGTGTMAELVAGADVVVTTYAVFRLDYEQFASQRWAGLVLDEAQFVKNQDAKANRLARSLEVPFKLAMTGTPMENSLDELRAIFEIAAPGLLGSRRQFQELYGKPVADGGEAGQQALGRLRQRVKPLLARRTKELVAKELPERQEQVFHVKLEPAQSRLYETYLQRERQRMLGLLEDREANQFAIFTSLTILRRAALDISLVDPESHGVPSSKLNVLMDQLGQVVAAGHRALVFSQFTSYLALVRQRLEEAGWQYAYLDGATTNRATVIRDFKRGTAPVFLISLKAGGFGLNLTEADYVYLLDPWWNPATENQAIDRTHRIGQERPVMVIRLVAQDTIEDKVMALKAKKRALFDAVMDQSGGFGSGLTAEDIKALVG
jgi:superfamily II DNA or RNA helicase